MTRIKRSSLGIEVGEPSNSSSRPAPVPSSTIPAAPALSPEPVRRSKSAEPFHTTRAAEELADLHEETEVIHLRMESLGNLLESELTRLRTRNEELEYQNQTLKERQYSELKKESRALIDEAKVLGDRGTMLWEVRADRMRTMILAWNKALEDQREHNQQMASSLAFLRVELEQRSNVWSGAAARYREVIEDGRKKFEKLEREQHALHVDWVSMREGMATLRHEFDCRVKEDMAGLVSSRKRVEELERELSAVRVEKRLLREQIERLNRERERHVLPASTQKCTKCSSAGKLVERFRKAYDNQAVRAEKWRLRLEESDNRISELEADNRGFRWLSDSAKEVMQRLGEGDGGEGIPWLVAKLEVSRRSVDELRCENEALRSLRRFCDLDAGKKAQDELPSGREAD